MAGGANSEDGDFGFQIAPMVDVVFVLLLFFMACAGARQTEGLFTIGLPSPLAGNSENIAPIHINIDAAGNIFVTGVAKGNAASAEVLETVTAELTRAMLNSPDDPVVIAPTLEAQHEWIVKILDCCRKAKVQKLSFS